jgi:hypothetical protein
VPYAVPAGTVETGDDRILRDLDALVTASETSLNPHRMAHALTKAARQLGIPTFTLQHGLENVGLTYFDDLHGANVSFASETILTWADPARLPADVPDDVRRRCRAVGRPWTPAQVAAPALPALTGKRVIGIFENLHWHRYPPDYRTAFVADLARLAAVRSDDVFLVKPHHLGRYLARHNALLGASHANIILADPHDPAWAPFTAPAVLPLCHAVISTPSTVVLDAVQAGLPVAVAQYGLPLPVYDGLDLLNGFEDWARFVETAVDQPDFQRARAEAFLARVTLAGNAPSRIADIVTGVETHEEAVAGASVVVPSAA